MLGKSSFIENICFICARNRDCGDMDNFRAKDVYAGTFNVILTPDVLLRYFFDNTTTNNNNNNTCDVSNDVTQLYIVHLWKLISLRSIRQIKNKYNNKNIMVQFNLLIKILFGNTNYIYV